MTEYKYIALYGLNARTVVAYGLVTAWNGSVILEDVNFSDQFDISYLSDDEGNTIGAKVTNNRATGIITYTPIGTTVAAAKTILAMPSALSLVRLYNFSDQINGFWNYAGGGSFSHSKSGRPIITMPIVRFTSITPQRLSVKTL